MNKFWIVIANHRILVKHETEADAMQEAERICKLDNVEVVLMEAVAVVEQKEPPVEWHVLNNDLEK